nr:MAG TPA: hypothetical protein [Caudoviricetes sp.]
MLNFLRSMFRRQSVIFLTRFYSFINTTFFLRTK